MSLHKSLKIEKSFGRRNVLNRIERIKLLKEQGKWAEGDPVTSLPKVKIFKLKKVKIEKKEIEEKTIYRTGD